VKMLSAKLSISVTVLGLSLLPIAPVLAQTAAPATVKDATGKIVGRTYDLRAVYIVSGSNKFLITASTPGFYDSQVNFFYANATCSGPALMQTYNLTPDAAFIPTTPKVSYSDDYSPTGTAYFSGSPKKMTINSSRAYNGISYSACSAFSMSSLFGPVVKVVLAGFKGPFAVK
jgi:hypothetical protein